jgi:hypothetical protein
MMLILLDIDGVMVPANSWKKPEFHVDGFPMFSVKAARALQKIISETGASVLLTTSHKLKYTVAQWRDIFKLRGIETENLQRLSSDSLITPRKDEILKWYTENCSPADDFVVIDDDKSLNDLPAKIKHNFVLTSSSVGLTDELADQAISILKGTLHTFSESNTTTAGRLVE